MQTVTFGTKNSYDDFGLILTDKNIGFPEPKLEEVDVIGADGIIELSIKHENFNLLLQF